MKNFTTVADWLKTNPTKEEQAKVLVVINRAALQETRKEIFTLKKFGKKIERAVKYMEDCKIPVSDEITKQLKENKTAIENLEILLPKVVRKEKK